MSIKNRLDKIERNLNPKKSGCVAIIEEKEGFVYIEGKRITMQEYEKALKNGDYIVDVATINDISGN